MRQSVVIATVFIELGELPDEASVSCEEALQSLQEMQVDSMHIKLVPTAHVLFDEQHQPTKVTDLSDGLVTFERYKKKRFV